MDILTAFILGIVEGLTEFLPISSTGHLILATRILNIYQTSFVKSFEITIQFGAILSVFMLYWKSLIFNLKILKRTVVSFLPTALVGIVFYNIFKQFLLGNEQIVLWSLFLGGIFIIIFELLYREEEERIDNLSKISYRRCFLIGSFQAISIIPGVSRAAATIIGGLILGLKRQTIVQFSFLLAIPTMLAAMGFDLIQSAGEFSLIQIDFLLIGLLASFFVALIAVKFFLSFIKKNTFILFGVYRIILALIFWFLIMK